MLDIYSGLSADAQETLLAFAEFLSSRNPETSTQDDQTIQEPVDIPRPEEESVVAAIKRLSTSYSMLDKSILLNETSSLMSQHILQGKGAVEVIDELEALFSRYYQEYADDKNGAE